MAVDSIWNLARAEEESENGGSVIVLPDIKANVFASPSTDVPYPVADFPPCVPERTVSIEVSINTGT